MNQRERARVLDISADDKELLDIFRERTKMLSAKRIAGITGVSVGTAHRIKKGNPTRLSTNTRFAMIHYLTVIGVIEKGSKWDIKVPRGTDKPVTSVEPSSESVTLGRFASSRVEQLIEMLEQKDALRRWAGTVPVRDLVKGAYQIAFDEGWTEKEFKQLDEWRRELLGSEGDES